MKNFGPFLAKLLAWTFLEGSKNLVIEYYHETKNVFQYFGEKKSSCEHFFSHSPCCLLKLWSGRAMLVRNPSLIFKCGNRNLKKFSSSVDNPGTHKYSSLGIDANSITLFTSNSSRNRNLTRLSDKFSIMAVTAFLIEGDWYGMLESFFTIWIIIVLIY